MGKGIRTQTMNKPPPLRHHTMACNRKSPVHSSLVSTSPAALLAVPALYTRGWTHPTREGHSASRQLSTCPAGDRGKGLVPNHDAHIQGRESSICTVLCIEKDASAKTRNSFLISPGNPEDRTNWDTAGKKEHRSLVWQLLTITGSCMGINSTSVGLRPSETQQPRGRQEEKTTTSWYSSPQTISSALGHLSAPRHLWNLETWRRERWLLDKCFFPAVSIHCYKTRNLKLSHLIKLHYRTKIHRYSTCQSLLTQHHSPEQTK